MGPHLTFGPSPHEPARERTELNCTAARGWVGGGGGLLVTLIVRVGPWRSKAHPLAAGFIPPCVTLHRVAVSLRGPGQSPVPRAASGRCVLSAAAACVPAGVVSAVAGPSSWHTGVLCWLLRGSFDGLCCPHPSAFWSSTTRLAVFLWACGPSGC